MFNRTRRDPTALAILASLITMPASAQTLLHSYAFTSGTSDGTGSVNGTLIGGSNVSGGTLNLDGTTGYVQFASNIIPTLGSYSVTLFARQSVRQNTFTELISQGFSGGPGFYIGTDLSGIIRASDSWGNTGTLFPQDNQWHHFAVTVDSSAAKTQLYIDGTPLATLNSAITFTSSGTTTRMGRQFAPYDEFFRGSLDDVGIYQGALTAAQVKNLASAPEPSVWASLSLGALGLGGLSLHARRRTQS